MTRRITRRRRRNMRGGIWGMKKTAKAAYEYLPDAGFQKNVIDPWKGHDFGINRTYDKIKPPDQGITTGIKKGFTDMTTQVGEKYQEHKDKRSKYRVEQLPTKSIFPAFPYNTPPAKPVEPILNIDKFIDGFLVKSYDEEKEYKTEYDAMIQYINSLPDSISIEVDLEGCTDYIKDISKYISDLEVYTKYIESEITKNSNKESPGLFVISDYKQKIKEIQSIKEPVEDYYSKTKPLLDDVNKFIDEHIKKIDDKIGQINTSISVPLINAKRVVKLELFKNSLENASSNLKILKETTYDYIIFVSTYFWMAYIVNLLKVQYASILNGESPKFQIDKDILPKAFNKANEECKIKITEQKNEIDKLKAKNNELQKENNDLMKDPNELYKIKFVKDNDNKLQKFNDEKDKIENNDALILDADGCTTTYKTAKRHSDALQADIDNGTITVADAPKKKIESFDATKKTLMEGIKNKVIQYALHYYAFEIKVYTALVRGTKVRSEFLANYNIYKDEWVQLLDSVRKVFESALLYYQHIDNEKAESHIESWINYFTAKRIWFKDYVYRPEYASYYSNYKQYRLLVFPPNNRLNSGTYVPARFKGLFQTLVYTRPNGGPEHELIKKIISDCGIKLTQDYNNIFTESNAGKGSKKKRKPSKRYKTRRRR